MNHLRVSDADRDSVAELLHTAYAEGRLTLEEHQERTDAALAARTFDDLTVLTADLLPGPGQEVVPTPASSVIQPAGALDEPDVMTAVLSTVRRQGRWRVRRSSTSSAYLGEVKLDMTEASFDAATVEITVSNVLGELSIRVPHGVTVRDEVTNVLGEVSIKDVAPPDPAMPTIVLRGSVFLGEVKVRGPRKPSSWRRALP